MKKKEQKLIECEAIAYGKNGSTGCTFSLLQLSFPCPTELYRSNIRTRLKAVTCTAGRGSFDLASRD